MFKRIFAVVVMGAVAVGGGCADVEDDGVEGEFRDKEPQSTKGASGTVNVQLRGIWEEPWLDFPWDDDPSLWELQNYAQSFLNEILNPALYTHEVLDQILLGQQVPEVCDAACFDIGMHYGQEYTVEATNVLVAGGPQWTGWQEGSQIEVEFMTFFDASLMCSCI